MSESQEHARRCIYTNFRAKWRISARLRLHRVSTTLPPEYRTYFSPSQAEIMTANRQSEVLEATQDIDFEANKYQIELNTTHGRIVLDLLPDVAPGHCANMIGLTKTRLLQRPVLSSHYRWIHDSGWLSAGHRHRGPRDTPSTPSLTIRPTLKASCRWHVRLIRILAGHNSSSAWERTRTWTDNTQHSAELR